METSQITACEHISGSVERVTFHSQETGFCVLQIKAHGRPDLITVTGSAASVSPGEYIDCQGNFVNDRQYGLQFKSALLTVVAPATIEGMEKYLASGMIKGMGPHFAKKLIKAFGEEVFTVIEQSPEKLLALPGIGRVRMQRVMAGWAEQKVIRDIMVFLQSYGVGTARAVRIYKTYGNDAIAKVSENPYQLALDVHGIGFNTADIIGRKLGIPNDSPMRARAGVRHALQELSGQGHCACVYEDLSQISSKLLSVPESLACTAIENEIAAGNLQLAETNGRRLIYLEHLYQAEEDIAKNLERLSRFKKTNSNNAAISKLESEEGIKLSHSQKNALALALSHKVLVITGGPGVGKTTLVKSIVDILRASETKVLLCAPTGRAAKRLAESAGLLAKTIHRTLEFNPKTAGFKHNAENPLETDVLIVDEVSMIDTVLMDKLLTAVPDAASVVLVGDVDQLPSVGPGNVLADIINSGVIPTVHLTEVFRQAAESKIVVNAHRINEGQMPDLELVSEDLGDFYFVNAESAEEITAKLLTVVCERIPKRFGFHPINDIQVLTPMNRGPLGARALNIELQKRLNSGHNRANDNESKQVQVSRFGSQYACGDKVIQLVNNYDKEVFNGDIGTIYSIDLEEGIIIIDFDGRTVEYQLSELDELALAYAVSIHKAQGSEYKAVVIPLSTAHYVMLERNLIYTAITRGKKLVVIIGQKKALAMAVNNKRANRRVTGLEHRLRHLIL